MNKPNNWNSINRLSCFLVRRCHFMRIADIYSTNINDADTIVKGWIKSVRIMKKKVFFDINDGSSFKNLQIVVERNNITPVEYGASVEVCGKLTQLESGQIEMHIKEMKIIGHGNLTEGYPFLPRTFHPPEHLREYPHLRPRTSNFGLLLRLRNSVSCAIHKYFQENGFIFTHTPILTSNDCEGSGEVFKVMPENKTLIEMMKEDEKQEDDAIFFNKSAYLTVSGQLHLECLARSLCKVYCFGPTFRAENSRSRFHLSEFYMVEAEVAFIQNVEEIMQIVEKMIKNVTISMLNDKEEDILKYKTILSLPRSLEYLKKIVNTDFTVITYDEAIRILKENNDRFVHPALENKPITKEHELYLVQYNGNVPVFVSHWPTCTKPFYMKTSEDKLKVASFDLLFPEIGEICGGGAREDDYNILEVKLKELDMSEKLDWYLQLRRFGNVPTGGFGMGFERYLQALLGTLNIKDTIPFPRSPHSCRC